MKKILAVLMASVCLITFGCQGKTEQNKSTGSNQFTLTTWASGTELTEFQQVIDRVNEKANGEYVVELQSIPSDYYVKLSTQIAAKRTPDFFWMTQELISKYADMGAIADLTTQFNASQELKPDDYYDGVLLSATYQNKYWGLPWIANPLIVYYNKTLFDQLGVNKPTPTDDWTWAEFIDTARQFNGKTNSKGEPVFGYIVDGWPNIETFIWSGGGDIIGADNETILLDSDEAIKGVGNLQTILKEGLTPKYSEVSSLGSNNVWFEKQRVAMFMGGAQDNFEKKLQKMDDASKFEIGYAPLPVADDGRAWSFNWTASTVMSKKLEGNELAYKAMEAVTIEMFDWKIAAPIKGTVEKVADIDPLKKDELETIAYTLNNSRSANYIPEWASINDKLWYNLYVKLLNDPNFDYVSEMKTIADYARDLISKRK